MSTDPTDPAVFEDHIRQWQTWQQEPWGRLRYAVVWHVLQRHLAELGAPPDSVRIVDVGGGDGTEAIRLAGLGYDVTLVDYSAGMLDIARRTAAQQGLEHRLTTVEGPIDRLDELDIGRFDVALCHFVIQYVADREAAILAIARRIRPRGLLSLVAPNPVSEVLAKAVRDLDFLGARDLLKAPTVRAETFDHDVARISTTEAEALVGTAGLDLLGRYGGRVVMDLIGDNTVKYHHATYAALERLELAVCDLSPYRDIGRFWHVVARRPDRSPSTG